VKTIFFVSQGPFSWNLVSQSLP